MTQLVPFESSKMPSFAVAGRMAGNVVNVAASGFPVISIKGGKFHVNRGGERTLIKSLENPAVPAAYIDVIILNVNPGGVEAPSKIFYATSYVEGADTKPDCYSADGISPAPDAVDPQSKKCAVCAHNQWGSRITENGKKAKVCQDSLRLAVTIPGAVSDSMLLRVPATSIKPFKEYLRGLKARRVGQYNMVLTRIGFNYDVAHQELTFTALGWLPEDVYAQVPEAAESEVTSLIIGSTFIEHETEQEYAALPVTAPQEVTAAPKGAVADDEDPKPRVRVKVEAEPEPVKAAPAPKKVDVKKAEAVVVDDLDEGLDAALDSVDWDD